MDGQSSDLERSSVVSLEEVRRELLNLVESQKRRESLCIESYGRLDAFDARHTHTHIERVRAVHT